MCADQDQCTRVRVHVRRWVRSGRSNNAQLASTSHTLRGGGTGYTYASMVGGASAPSPNSAPMSASDTVFIPRLNAFEYRRSCTCDAHEQGGPRWLKTSSLQFAFSAKIKRANQARWSMLAQNEPLHFEFSGQTSQRPKSSDSRDYVEKTVSR